MNLGDLASLPPTLTTEQAAPIFGCGVDHLWKLARDGKAPVEPLRLGNKIMWPTARVLAAIGLDPETPSEAAEVVVPMHRAAR